MNAPSEPAKLSVVMPTYQCRKLMEQHLGPMKTWADLADEIVVVDSRSTDGTVELIRAELRHPKLRIIQRGKGLYASWNEGVAATSGRWVYISTAGETITRQHLLTMLKKGESAKADVIISPCDFVDEEGRPKPGVRKNPGIYSELAAQGDVLIAPPAVRYFAFRSAGTHALLGSCASELFRGDFLRARPFPEDYGTHGDTAWLLRHAHEMRLCVLQSVGSTFCLHQPSFPETKEARRLVLDRMHAKEIAAGGITPVLTSSIRLRGLMGRRKVAWKGLASALVWASANVSYMRAKLEHQKLEAEEMRRLKGLIMPVQ